ncbi:MAG: bifunctional pyr operon transcriptional regulator/uracil phosphoribosyltransferase PyrR [Ruminococcaceae bacterium]|nr:bifunctional pyr operon transcriptional regulator/uracil phosphoribosyltransferase PyrR [Oscillospiraceae bacterium]
MEFKTALFDENMMMRVIRRISHEIIEKNENVNDICLVGIKTRGVPIAKRISDCIYNIENVRPPVGTLDISQHRDDIDKDLSDKTALSNIDFAITDKNVILVDDVVHTGRTVRAALDAIMTFGRPAKIQLAAIVDRGHRELPIRADFVGKNVPTSKTEVIRVSIKEIDGKDIIELFEM